jgi:hypothetical protein
MWPWITGKDWCIRTANWFSSTHTGRTIMPKSNDPRRSMDDWQSIRPHWAIRIITKYELRAAPTTDSPGIVPTDCSLSPLFWTFPSMFRSFRSRPWM